MPGTEAFFEKSRSGEFVNPQAEIEWVKGQITEIGPEKLNQLVDQAIKVRENAYKPYTHYSVGASILTVSGNFYVGCNNEVVTLNESGHAERNAIAGAIINGEIKANGRRFLKALVVSHEGDSDPCGGCRQAMMEHSDNLLVISVDEIGNLRGVTSLKTLLPNAFTPTHLGIK